MRWSLLLMLAVILNGCSQTSSTPSNSSVAERNASKLPPPDESQRFPQANLVKMERIPDHLLGKSFMPGGNLATYRNGKTEFQQFLGKKSNAQDAAFLLLDWQKALQNADYIAHMGGYFGTDNGRPIYVFTKGAWVAGFVGLPQAQADALARAFAARF